MDVEQSCRGSIRECAPHTYRYLPSQLACVALYTSNRIMKPDGPEATSIPGPYDVHLMRQMEDELLKVFLVLGLIH